MSLQLNATDVGGAPTYSATGLPAGLSLNAATGLISGTVGIGLYGSSPYQVTVTATDGGATSSQSFVWTVTPRVALVNPGSQSNATGDNVSLQLSATSPGGTMSYSASGLPDGLSLNSSTGLLSGTVAADAASSTPYTVTVRASDGTSSSSQTFTWTVSAINLVSPGDPSNLDGDTVSLPLTTSYHGSGTLSYSATGLPPGLNIDPSSGQISGTIDSTADTNSPYQVMVTATDGTNTASQSFNWTVSPRLSMDPIDPTNAVGDVVSLQVSASDAANGTLTYSASGLPPGLNIDSSTGLISGTIATGADTSSPYNVTVTADDGVAGVSQSFAWTVMHLSLVNPGSQASADGQTVSLAVQGGDADGDAVSWTASGLPTGLSINGSTGLISGTIASNADTNSPYNVTVTVGDGVNSASQSFLWTVGPVALTAPADQTNTEGDSVSLQLQGVSNGGSLTYSASGLPDGLSLNATTGLISGVIAAGAAAEGPFTVDVAVSNGVVSSSQTFTWNVNPVVSLTAPSDQSNSEGDNVSLSLSASDSMNANLTYTADGLPSGLSINSTTGLISGTIAAGDSSGGPYAVTVAASDGTYSTSQAFNWTITHTDTTPPTMSTPGTQTNVAGDSVSLPVNASDADGDALTYSATGLPDGLDIDPSSGVISGTVADDAVSTTPYAVTVTAADSNGQSVSQTFTWLVNAPTLTVQSTPVSIVGSSDSGSITVATFTTPDLNSQASDFTATIDWGDGTTDTGIVDGDTGSFTVTGDHSYATPGNYALQVQITGPDGTTITTSGTATVQAATVAVTGGFQLGAIQYQSATLTLATFTSSDPNAQVGDYTAAIDWGDGNGPQSATIMDLGDGVFGVSGSNSYSQQGTFTATVTVINADGIKTTADSTVVVGDIYAGLPSSLTVASFSDPDPHVQASDYTASINWGDGNTSAGTVTGGYGSFSVQGSHKYANDSLDQPGGTYAVTVTVKGGEHNNTLTYSTPVTVVRPPLSLTVADQDISKSLTLNNVQVATFTDPDASDAASEFTAQIDWGDGTPLDTTGVVQGGGGLFQVLGSHTYAANGWYTITVQISQGWRVQKPAARKPEEANGKPIIQFLANVDKGLGPQLSSVNTLHVGKWTNAFLGVGRNMQLKRGDFISLDPDHFYVQVKDPMANKNRGQKDTIQVYVDTSSDLGDDITLTETGVNTGLFRSRSLLLTSVSVDKQAGDGRALNVLLGDAVSASYGEEKAKATVPVQKVVKLHVNILSVAKGKPAASATQVVHDLLWANAIYAQAGIQLKASAQIVDPLAKANISKGILTHFVFGANWDSGGGIPMTTAERNLLGAAQLRSNAKGVIEVYYVNNFVDGKGDPIKDGLGESFPASLVPAQYANSIIISANFEKYQTLAHEVGHILFNNGKHDSRIVNLMVRGLPQDDGEVTDSRRIPDGEAKAMLKSKLASNPPTQ